MLAFLQRWVRRLRRRLASGRALRALADADRRESDDDARRALHDELIASTLFVLVPEAARDQIPHLTEHLRGDGEMPISGIARVGGDQVWAVFSSRRAAQRWSMEPAVAAPVPALDVLTAASVNRCRLLLDAQADGRHRAVFDLDEVDSLAAGLELDPDDGAWKAGPRTAFRVQSCTPVANDALCAVLATAVGRVDAIETAHLFTMAFGPQVDTVVMGVTCNECPPPEGGLEQALRAQLGDVLPVAGALPVLLVADEMRDDVYARGTPVFVRGASAIDPDMVDEGNAIRVILPAPRPQLARLDSGWLVADLGPGVDDVLDSIERVRAAVSEDRPEGVVWVVQRTAADALAGAPASVEALQAVVGAPLGDSPGLQQMVVASMETPAGRSLARRLGENGVGVHAFGPAREVAVEVHRVDDTVFTLPGRLIVAPPAVVSSARH